MHEWALADSVVSTVIWSLDGRDPASLRLVQVRIGELQAVDWEIFRFSLQNLFEPYGIDPKRIILETEKAELLCGACGNRWGLADDRSLSGEISEAIHFLPEAVHAFIRCPSCGSADFSVDKGRGVTIARIEVAENGESAG